MSARAKYWLAAAVWVVLAVWFLWGSGVHLNVGQVILFWAVVYAAQGLAVLARDL